jgi:hypothetical protein
MTMYGWMFINDLGNIKECRKHGFSDYALVTANLTRLPLTIYFGACVPSQCKQEDFNEATNAVTKALTSIYKPFAPKQEGEGMFQPDTEIMMKFTKTDELLEGWRANTRFGYLLLMFIGLPLLIILGLIPTLYHAFIKQRRAK